MDGDPVDIWHSCDFLHQVISNFSCRMTRFTSLVSVEVKALSHVDADSNLPKMVDVGGKNITKREAHARSVILLPSVIADYFKQGREGSLSKKVM